MVRSKEIVKYIHTLPARPSFRGKGVHGYTFGPLLENDVELYYIIVDKGHDIFIISKQITRIYYVLAGEGYFTIDNQRYDVCPGVVVEVPPNVEYSYSGKMTLLGFSKPRWFDGNDTMTQWNLDVVQCTSPPCGPDYGSWISRLARIRILGKSPVSAYLRINDRFWNAAPRSLTALKGLDLYGKFLHSLARAQGRRQQAFSTFFLRNRPQLELIRRIVDSKKSGQRVRVAIIGSSTGAEVYSVMWRIRSARPDLVVTLQAVDIAPEAVEFARRGVYQATTKELAGTPICERMTPTEMTEFFDRDGDVLEVKPWIKEGINWHVKDAMESDMLEAFGPQDIVLANNFLCHMNSHQAELCLRNIAELVSPTGYLFVSGVDLGVRTEVTANLGLVSVEELLDEIHEGDPCMRKFWPCHYGGLEPLDKKREDWRRRYAAAFQAPEKGVSQKSSGEEMSIKA